MGSCGAIGIDLGTTFSCVGVYKQGRVEIIKNDTNDRTTPSVVAFGEEGQLVGKAAVRESESNPQNTIFGVKRLMGRQFDDSEVQQDIKMMPYKVENQDSNPVIKVKYGKKKTDLTVYPEQISATILKKMKAVAEQFLGGGVTDAVITVPAYFNDGQRQATKDSAIIAGFKNIKMINEPTAAAIAYGLENVIEESKTVLIFDLGGGTFDVSIVKVSANSNFDVIVTAGDTHLGGDDFDKRLLKHFAEEFEKKTSQKISENPKALGKLRSACVDAKINLSSSSNVSVDVEPLMNGIDFNSKITRAKFDDLCDDLFRKTIKTVKEALKDAKLDKSKIDHVVLVGGSTRIPKIQQLLQKFFENKELKHSVNPDEAVAYGAAIYAAKCFGVEDTMISELRLSDVTPLSLGVVMKGNVMSKIIKRNTQIPTEATENYFTTKDEQTEADIIVYEGERSIASENHKLGSFELRGIPPLPRGQGKIECTMKIDSDGILTVTGVVTANGNTESLKISNEKGRLSEAEIERMIEEAKRFEELDKEHLKRAAAKNELENYAYSIKSSLKNNANRRNTEEFKKAIAACEETIKWANSNNSVTIEEIESKHRQLRQICSAVIQ